MGLFNPSLQGSIPCALLVTHVLELCIGLGHIRQCVTRVKNVKSRREREIWNKFLQFREQKEKFEINFSTFKKRKRNLKTILHFWEEKEKCEIIFLLLRREIEIQKQHFHHQEEKEKYENNLSTFEKRKRNIVPSLPFLRGEREMLNHFLHFREEKEKFE